VNPDKRLGNDIKVLKRHPFFVSIDWDNLRTMKPLFVPQLENQFDVSYFECIDRNTPSNTVHRFSRYYKKCLKKTEQDCNILQVKLQGLHRSRSFDVSELHAHNVPHWVTPFKRTIRLSVDPQVKKTPTRDSPMTPCSDKQILGFTFQRKQSSRVRNIDTNHLPTFRLHQDITEKTEEMMDVQ